MPASREPQNINPDTWYYEYPTYLYLVRRVKNSAGDYLKTEGIKVPWRMVKTSIRRAYKPRKRKARR